MQNKAWIKQETVGRTAKKAYGRVVWRVKDSPNTNTEWEERHHVADFETFQDALDFCQSKDVETIMVYFVLLEKWEEYGDLGDKPGIAQDWVDE